MKNFLKRHWFIITILIVGAFLRLASLGSIPNALTWDEAALGYNAFSILKTGRDEYGKLLPLIFKSFGDYKPGLYVYLAIPSIAIFGLNEFAVRLPNALFGILAIFGVYLLVKEIFYENKKKELLASFSALSLAIMPLHIHFSRGAWETNVFCALLLFSIYFLVKFVRTGHGLWLSIILSLLTLITYQAAKLLTPLVFVFTALTFWPDFFRHLKSFIQKKSNLVFLGLSLIVVFAFLLSTVTGDAGNRLKRLSILGYHPEVSEQTKQIDNNPVSISLFHNQNQLTTRLIAGRYLKHLSPKVLFYEGIAVVERGHFPGLGALQPFDFIWLVLGLIFLIKFAKPRAAVLLLGLLILAPLPGSLTLSDYSTVRSLFMAIPLAIICGLGYAYAFSHLKPVFALASAITALLFLYFLDLLFVHANFTYAREFQYGYKQAILFSQKYPDSKIVMTDVYGQPYIFYLFYTQYDPAKYQKIDRLEDGGVDVGKVFRLDNIEFHQFGTSEISTQKNTVFAGTIGNVPESYPFTDPNIEAHEDVRYPDGEVVFRLIKTKAETTKNK